jgi:hypothetical protein
MSLYLPFASRFQPPERRLQPAIPLVVDPRPLVFPITNDKSSSFNSPSFNHGPGWDGETCNFIPEASWAMLSPCCWDVAYEKYSKRWVIFSPGPSY